MSVRGWEWRGRRVCEHRHLVGVPHLRRRLYVWRCVACRRRVTPGEHWPTVEAETPAGDYDG